MKKIINIYLKKREKWSLKLSYRNFEWIKIIELLELTMKATCKIEYIKRVSINNYYNNNI